MMLATPIDEVSPARAPGRLGQALRRLLMRQATIVANETLARRFRLVTLEGPALRDVAWSAGQKVQIAIGAGFATRTYTPIEWNAGTGRACILGYVHGDGPGSDWLARIRPGDTCDLFGPRGSIDAGRIDAPLALFGDETAMGLGYALTRADPARPVACHFETSDIAAGRTLLADLGLPDAALFSRRADDAHLGDMEPALAAQASLGACFVLAGKAGTIQRWRQSLGARDVPGTRILTKAYWAPGKTGLD